MSDQRPTHTGDPTYQIMQDENGVTKVTGLPMTYGQGFCDLFALFPPPVTIHLKQEDTTRVGFSLTGKSLRETLDLARFKVSWPR